MTADRREDDIADALADLQGRKTRGEGTDVLAYRERLGESHAEFLLLADTDALLDDLIEPPPAEVLPRELGPYTLLRELGRGAVGVVYEAVHRTLRRRAAVKVLRHGFDADPQARERFRNEAASSARVRHDHVVEIYDASEVDGRPYFAMTLVEGRSLASLIKAREVPPVRALCKELAGVADALAALHAANVLHRDIKPSNLMVRPDGRILLADFGLARSSEGMGLTRTGDALGTPLYMSPEQMLGRRDEVDARADVYALGATLYEAIAGRPVFDAPDIAALARQVVAERPEPLRKAAPGCPATVEKIVMKALEKEKADRYESAAAMRDDLLAFAAGRDGDVVGRPVGGTVRLLRAVRERWVPVAAGALVAFGAAWWWTHRAGTVEFRSEPDGVEVLVGGVVRGTTPAKLDLAPGEYDVTFRTDGFLERARRVEVAAGGKVYVEVPLQPRDEKDPVARMRLARSLELASVPYFTSGDRARGGGTVLLRPFGDVRLADLEDLEFELGRDDLDGLILEFRRETELLSSAPFDPPESRGRQPIPAAVREALKVGDTVTWGLYPTKARLRAGAKATSAQFRVVDLDPASALARIDRALPEEASSALRGEMKVRALEQLGLARLALDEADRLADAHPDVLALQSLARQLYKAHKLGDADRAFVLGQRIQKFPASEVDRLTAANPGEEK